MKTKSLIPLFISLLFISCSSDDENFSSFSLFGQWQLKQMEIINFQDNPRQEFNENDVVFTFSSDGSLTVESNVEDFQSYDSTYELIVDCLISGCPNGEIASQILVIGTTRHEFIRDGNEIRFGTGYVDGPSYVLERSR